MLALDALLTSLLKLHLQLANVLMSRITRTHKVFSADVAGKELISLSVQQATNTSSREFLKKAK